MTQEAENRAGLREKMSEGRKLEAVLFDMDGVIIDSEPLWSEAEKQLLARRKLSYSAELKEVLMGRGSREAAGIFIEYYNLTESVDDILTERNQLIAELFRDCLQPIPQALDLIGSLRKSGIKTALASSSPKYLIDLAMDKFGIAGLFDLILSGDEVGRGKPAPDIYLRAAKELGVTPENCVVVEDAPSGVAAARAAGMRCLAVGTSASQSGLVAADRVVGGLEEVNLQSLQEL